MGRENAEHRIGQKKELLEKENEREREMQELYLRKLLFSGQKGPFFPSGVELGMQKSVKSRNISLLINLKLFLVFKYERKSLQPQDLIT